MRLVTTRTASGTRAARLDEDGSAVLLDAPDVRRLLEATPDWMGVVGDASGERLGADQLDLAPVVPRPGKIVCLGLNYRSHIVEMGRDLPSHPTLFAKFAESLIGPYDDIQMPAVSHWVDWEAELAVVIGRPARHVAEADALDHVAGYTIMNDVTVRDWQWRTKEFLAGKTFEATSPLGPHLVSPDELPDGGLGLDIGCEVDGQVMQHATTADLLFTPAQIIADVSTIVTLQPGDVIATGTPGGVGAARDPRVFLRPGQLVRTWVEGVGELRNRCAPPVGGSAPADRDTVANPA